MTQTEERQSEAAILVREAGIDPYDVCAFGVTAQGYFEYQRDIDGRVTHKAWREWPNQSVGSAVYQALNPQ